MNDQRTIARCALCGAFLPGPFGRKLCRECALRKITLRAYSAAATLALALALTLPYPAHAAPVASAPGPACTYSNVSLDDGSRYAVCPDGSAWYFDADGQRYANAAGVPVRAPGWVRVA